MSTRAEASIEVVRRNALSASNGGAAPGILAVVANRHHRSHPEIGP